MSDKKGAPDQARVVPGRTTPAPAYHYQQYHGKSGSLSTKAPASPERKVPALQNFVLNQA